MPWIERRTIDYFIDKLPFSNEEVLELIDFSRLRVVLPGIKSAYDLGALCFKERKRKQGHPFQADYIIWLVRPQTLCSERKNAIQQFAKYIYSLHSFGKRPRTISNSITIFIRFIEWCDKHYPTVFLTFSDARKSYALYTQALLEEVRSNKLHINSAAMKQRMMTTILNAIFEEQHGVLTAGMKKIRVNTSAATATTPPSEINVRKVIDLYTQLFTQISKFLLDFEPYPFQIKLPNEMVWVFPGHIPFATASMLANRHEWKQEFWAWDYMQGEIATYEAIRSHYTQPNAGKKAIENAKNLLESANFDQQHRARLGLAALSIQCFTLLFIANTAMNITPLSQLSWETDNDFECIKSSKQGFRTIKHRAGGAYVEFHITNNFLCYFKKYLKLRKWILHGVKAPLFFILDKGWHPKKIDDSLTFKLRKKLRMFDLNHPSARQWRAYKADWLIRTTDLDTTSLLLQNKKETVIQNYISGSKIRADEEMTEFFSTMHGKVVKPNTLPTVEISVGQCREPQLPKSENPQNTIQPDCSQPEGCLFCAKYQVHSDSNDVRKLWSCRYVITETRTLAASAAHFEKIFRPVLQRIDALLKCISLKNEALQHTVEDIKHEVMEEGKLTPYWGSKLQMLIELGII